MDLRPVAAVLVTFLLIPPVPAAAPTGTAPVAGPPPGSARSAVPPPTVAPAPQGAAFRWPLPGPAAVVRPFDPPPQRWLPGHRGVDLAVAPGMPVLTAGDGTVLYAGRLAGRGVLSVVHAGGLRTTYEPVDADPAIRAGVPVRAGQRLGAVAAGHPGCPAPACLHWGLRDGRQYLDPLALVGLGRMRLWPVPVGAFRLDAPTGPVVRAPSGPGQRSAASRAGRRSASRSYSSARL